MRNALWPDGKTLSTFTSTPKKKKTGPGKEMKELIHTVPAAAVILWKSQVLTSIPGISSVISPQKKKLYDPRLEIDALG